MSLHLILFMSFAATAVMKGLGLSSLTTIIVGSWVIGSYMAVFLTCSGMPAKILSNRMSIQLLMLP
ncbi:hypothetical protein LLE87_09410 [Paenibacillus polymyxa]|nr:hypothetical protein [Paenibacillus polymyxa]MCC3258393.1 hypothetical protein [Paenibacillus polymyxa]